LILDPLVEPCICSGSVKYIHLSCIKAWINEQLTQDIEEDVKSYCWERIKCELCHTNFKEVVENKGRKFKIFEKEKIDNDTHLVMESIYPDDIKIYFGLLLKEGETKKSFMIGRSRTCNVKLNLDSISRNHSEIIYEKGGFYLKDVGSTFGTLVLLRQPLMFNRRHKNEVAIQSGPTMIEIKHGGVKKVEHTYVNKEGDQKKCAVYEEFMHKIPKKMREFIDESNEILEVIRADDYKKINSNKNIPGSNLEYESVPNYASSNQIPHINFQRDRKELPHNIIVDTSLNASELNLQLPGQNKAGPGRSSFGAVDSNSPSVSQEINNILENSENNSPNYGKNARFGKRMAEIAEEEEEKIDVMDKKHRLIEENEFLNCNSSIDVKDAWNQNLPIDALQSTININHKD
jgi:hypothetical protein